MNELQIKAILAGLAFGIWPLVMNRSGLVGNVSSMAFGLIATLGVLPFALRSMGGSFPTANWTAVVIAGLIGACGLLFFNGMLAKATPQNVGLMFVTMIVVQTAIPALYQVVMNGELSLRKAAGFALAFASAYLLVK
ncbi:MAG TPA: hypothetical protein VN281_09865 [Verrucomicrobiae bacterium]|jgi:hypothetical protein|nr:hypothetical protein [Verrucomicrobiae bacterium]